jgi:REP element-mobilizing transposase RayT
MVRRPRLDYEGAVHHVYNRVASGEGMFDDPEEARRFLDLMREVKERDGWSVFAWTLLPNHFHAALRSSVAPLSRGMHTLQCRFSRGFNRRRGRTGGLWQSRYQARIVDQPRYLSQVVLYIHLNPVRAGLVEDPADYVLSGHREIVRRTRRPLIDADDALLCFDERMKAARRAYLAGIRAGVEGWKGKQPGPLTEGLRGLVWADRELVSRTGTGASDDRQTLGVRERPHPDTEEFVAQSCGWMEIDVERVAGRTRDPETARARRIIATLGVERWGQRCVDLARVLHKNPHVVSWWVSQGCRQRREDPSFSSTIEELDDALSGDKLEP